MQDMVWDADLETGDRTIDLQHMQLFVSVRDLTAAAKAGAERPEIAEHIFDLLRYAGTHFADEEDLMAQTGYPNLERQVREHVAFAVEVTRLATEFLAERDAPVTDLLDYVSAWLLAHVDTEDRELAVYLRECRAQARRS